MQTIRIVFFFFLKTRMRDNTTSQKGENETNPGETLAANLWQRTLVRTPGSPEFAAGVHHWSSPASVFARVRFIVPSSPGFGKWSSLLPFSGGGLFCPSLSLSLGRLSCSSVLIVLNPLFFHTDRNRIILLWLVLFSLFFGSGVPSSLWVFSFFTVQNLTRATLPRAKREQRKSSRTPSTPSHARSQACRTGGHALGAWYTACSMIPGSGVYRVRRRRFAEERSAD